VNPVITDIVAKLWNLCNILKDDGVTYHQYVTELTYLLFLKLANETNTEHLIPKAYRWEKLEGKPQAERLSFYKSILKALGKQKNPMVKEIYADANSSIKKAASLARLVTEIDKLDWFSTQQEQLGDLYEGLLEKNSNEKKSGAGQYFTPRPLIESIVAVMQPTLADIIQDPAAGTGGFLITANKYLRDHTDPSSWTKEELQKYKTNTFYGMEHVQETHRLALMNLMLHGLDYDPNEAGIRYGDTLSSDGAKLPKATLILSNPPFGTKSGGGLPSRVDFPFPTSNKQFCFVQHIYLGLQPGGRAAVILPENVLFEGNVGKQIRADLMNKCNLHTILRLPTGIFYAQGVKTNVLFFTRGKTDKNNTKEVWVYDLRANMPQYGKRTQLIRDHFKEFETAFGNDPFGQPKSLAKRKDTGEEGKFRKFSRKYILERNESLDISWLKDENEEKSEDLPEPAILARSAMSELEAALKDIQGILAELSQEFETAA
jgi:type I restriction enzyme M protein